jgi:hypothetical protein
MWVLESGAVRRNKPHHRYEDEARDAKVQQVSLQLFAFSFGFYLRRDFLGLL